MQDATKVLLGTVKSSKRSVTCENGDPATYKAGLAVRRATTGGLQLADDDVAVLIGVSLGRDLSNAKNTAVCRKGLGVPLKQKGYAATGTITISNYTNAQGDSAVVAGVAFVGQAGAATPGAATFQSAASNDAAATSLALQINSHATTTALVTAVANAAIVTITAKATGTGGNAITTTWTDVSTSGGSAQQAALTGGIAGPAVYGKPVYVNDAGLGCKSADADATATNATYATGLLTGVDKIEGTTSDVACIDMVGGL